MGFVVDVTEILAKATLNCPATAAAKRIKFDMINLLVQAAGDIFVRAPGGSSDHLGLRQQGDEM